MSNCRVIAVVNQKGGVGKTTTAINLATGLAAIYKKTLIIDIDPQGNASTGLGIAQRDRQINIYDVLLEDINIKQAILDTIVPKLNIIPANVDLAAAEAELINKENREFILKDKISSILSDFDYIIIDCPPSLGMLTINSLVASQSMIIPLQCEFFALEGLSHLLKTISLIKRNLNKSIEIEGVVLTMYDKRNKLTEQIEADVRECLKDKVYRTTIPRNVRASEAPSHGKPLMIYDVKSPGAIAYLHLAKEILEKHNNLTLETI